MTDGAGILAPAKLNLALHVTGRRPDGYHLLDSLVVFAGVGDRLTAQPSGQTALEVTGPFADGVPTGPDNLVLRALALLGTGAHARVTLDKRLPHAAGIGGGSSDAAAMLRLGARLFDRPLPPAREILGLGADVPVCVAGAPARMRGIGDILEPVPALPSLWTVLVNPGVATPTGAVFSGLASRENAPMDPPCWSDAGSFLAWLAAQRNDLENPARSLVPEIAECLRILAGTSGCHLVRMSGSGATCFGLFTDKAVAASAAERVRRAHPDWWVESAPILPGPVS